jgi:hypothetical protein
MIKKEKSLYYFVLAFVMFLWACNSTRLNVTPASSNERHTSMSTEMAEEAVIATQLTVQTQTALTQTVSPTMTLMSIAKPTQSTTLVPTLHPLPNSTPIGKGAYFIVPSDAL